MLIRQQLVLVLSLYNEAVLQGQAPGAVWQIEIVKVVIALLFGAMLACLILILTDASCRRTLASLVLASVVVYITLCFTGRADGGIAIVKNPGVVGLYAGMQGSPPISLVPLFANDTRVVVNEQAQSRQEELARLVDLLYTLTVEQRVMRSQ